MKKSNLPLFKTKLVDHSDFSHLLSSKAPQFPSGSQPTRPTGFLRSVVLVALLLIGQVNGLLAQNPLTAAGKFNVFLATDATLATNESEGAIAIGGNLTVAGNYQVATQGSATPFTVNGFPIGLVVGGGVKLQQGTLQVNSNHYAKIGACGGNAATDALKVWYQDSNGAYSLIRVTKATGNYADTPAILINQNATASTQTNAPVCQGNVINFASSFATLKNNSVRLAANASRVKLTDASGQPISGTNPPDQVKIGLFSGINVWNVTGADLNQIQNLTYTDAPSSGQVLVINVNAAGAFTWTTPSLSGVNESNAPYILWNFYNTTQLTIGGSSTIEGSLLAPLANVIKTVNQSNIQGQLVANSFSQSGGEMHHYPFNADLTPLLSPPDLTPIIFARPSTVYNTTPITVVVNVVELLNVATSGLITVKIPKDPKFILSFTSGSTSVNNRPVQNSAWSFSGPSGGFYTLTTNRVIAAGGVLSFGLTGTLTPGATQGTLTVSSIISGGSGGETRIDNNNDADKIDYFQN